MTRLPYEQVFPEKKKTGNKYNAKKVVIDGITFHSTKEGNRYLQLKQLRRAKNPEDRVVEIKTQVKYPVRVEGKHICDYRTDFVVTYADGRTEIEDVKGYKKGAGYQLFKLKKKLVEALYNVDITET